MAEAASAPPPAGEAANAISATPTQDNTPDATEHHVPAADATDGGAASPDASATNARSAPARPGSLTKRTGRRGGSRAAGSDVSSPERSETSKTWNKFGQAEPHGRAKVDVQPYSKEERAKLTHWHEERRAIHERTLRIQQKKAEAEAAARQAALDARAAERRARVEARMAAQQEKIAKAAAEREAREVAYQQLLERTRERGLLYDRLATTGEAKLERLAKEKEQEWKNTTGKVMKVSAAEIQARTELHPALKQAQRTQAVDNQRREAAKPPNAFTAHGMGEHALDHRALPGSHMGSAMSSLAGSDVESHSHSPSRAPRSARRRAAPLHRVDRGTDPVAIPGVEVLVHGRPWVPPVDTDAPPPRPADSSFPIAAPARERNTSGARDSKGAAAAAYQAPSRTASGIAGAGGGSAKGSKLSVAAAEAAMAEAAAAVSAAQAAESDAVDAAMNAAKASAVETPQASQQLVEDAPAAAVEGEEADADVEGQQVDADVDDNAQEKDASNDSAGVEQVEGAETADAGEAADEPKAGQDEEE